MKSIQRIREVGWVFAALGPSALGRGGMLIPPLLEHRAAITFSTGPWEVYVQIAPYTGVFFIRVGGTFEFAVRHEVVD